MIIRNQYALFSIAMLAVILAVFLISPPRRVKIVVDKLPSNTPPGAVIFIAGNFNYWDAGDGNFQLEKGEDGKYRIELPLAWGGVQYKFNRGDWTSVEGDGCGHSIGNRIVSDRDGGQNLNENQEFTNQIFSWQDLGPTDCDKVVIQLSHIPRETPIDGPIYISGSFNDWNPKHPAAQFRKNEKGIYFIDLPKSDKEIEFKITRGSWSTEEVDENGDRIPNRKFNFGKIDTLNLEIPGWIDIKPGIESRKVTFLVTTPLGTPVNDPLFIVGSFNNWKPADPKYRLTRLSPNLFSITINKPEGEMEFKFTRGNWDKEELDVFGNHISNRRLRTSADTVRISIPEWNDIPLDQTFSVKGKVSEGNLSEPRILSFPPDDCQNSVNFRIRNHSDKEVTLYTRLALPIAPFNRNYGFVAKLAPGEDYRFSCPPGSKIYACDGRYWDNYKPKESLVLIVDNSRRRVELDADWLVWKPNMKPLEMKTLPEALDVKIPPVTPSSK